MVSSSELMAYCPTMGRAMLEDKRDDTTRCQCVKSILVACLNSLTDEVSKYARHAA